ncbi:hypothetical protein C8039_18910 [Halogeometricum sp. wsp3]|nr:hypothetical protein C8039_18910 [Halogeometricum sp. wsp3]
MGPERTQSERRRVTPEAAKRTVSPAEYKDRPTAGVVHRDSRDARYTQQTLRHASPIGVEQAIATTATRDTTMRLLYIVVNLLSER